MRIFITGIAGFLGSHLADWFLDRDHEVAGCDNLFSGERQNVPDGVKFHAHDITQLDGYAGLLRGTDVLFHCAAAAYEGMSVFAPAFISHNIYGGSATTFSAAIQAGVRRVVFCSSMARYGVNTVPFRETMLPAPVDPYGLAKHGAERLLKNLATVHGLEWTIAVPHNVFGPRQRYVDPYRNVASIMTNLLLQDRPPLIYGDGNQQRCFSYISDCLGCLGAMGTSDGVLGQVVNIGPDEEFITINELAARLGRLTGNTRPPIYLPGRPQEVRDATCSADKARALLGYRTTIGLDDGLAYLIADIRRRGVRPFDYHFTPEFVTAATPRSWTERLL